MSLQDWQKHVRQTHEHKKDLAWCGVDLSGFDWYFVNVDHAAYAAPRDRLQPCPACVRAITDALNGKAPP